MTKHGFIAAMITVAGAAAAQPFTLTGDTTGGPVWNRPVSLTALSGVGTATPWASNTFTPAVGGLFNIASTQAGGWDGYLFLYEGTFDPANQFAGLLALDDDGVGGIGTSNIDNIALTGGQLYTVVTTGFGNTDFGAYTNTVTQVQSECVSFSNQTNENEPACADDYIDATNGGCNAAGEASPIADGQTYFGTAGTYFDNLSGFETRDTDWFEFTVTELTTVTWTVTAEFPVLAGIVDVAGQGFGGCATAAFLSSAVAGTCVPVTVSAVVGPGTWYAFAAPSTFTGVACGSEYVATFDAETFVVVAPTPDVELGQVADPNVPFSIDSFDSDYDTELGVYDEAGALLANNDDAGGTLQSAIDFTAGLPEGLYYMAAGGFNTTFGAGFAATATGGTDFGSLGGLVNLTTYGPIATVGDDITWLTFNVGAAVVCRPDFNDDGVLNIFDIFAFFNAFGAGNLTADFTGDGNLNIFDIFGFFNEFGAGCP